MWIDDWLAQGPIPDYADYVDPTMPTRDQFSTDDAYDQAMIDWAYDRNGGRAFAPPTATPYTRDDGSQGTWYTAGTTREETSGEYWANYLNNMWLRDGGAPRGLDNIGFQSWLGLHPDEAQAAIMAVDPVTGGPLLEPGLIQYLLDSGVRMPSRDPGQVIGDPASGGVGQPDPRYGFIDTGQGYWTNAAGGMSAYQDPASGQWTYYVLGQDGQTWSPMTPDQFARFWDISPSGGGVDRTGWFEEPIGPPPTHVGGGMPIAPPQYGYSAGQPGSAQMALPEEMPERIARWLAARRRNQKWGPRPV